MSMHFFDVNDVVVSQRTFAADGSAVDPTLVKVKYKDPSGNSTAWLVYGTDVEVTRPAAGVYSIRIGVDEAGLWRVRWESTGTYASAIEDQFYVRTNSF